MTLLSRLPVLFLVPCLALLATTSAQADAALLERVHAFLYERASSQGEEVVIELRPPSARLGACEAPDPFLTRDDAEVIGRVSVGVRCGEEGRQVRYLQARVGVMGEYPVPVEDIAAGTVLTPELLETRRGDLAELPRGTVHDAEDLVGQVARRRVRAGEPMRELQFAIPALVERGQRVIIEARGENFRVTREGEALDAGGTGERVRVRLANRELVTARVADDGRLVVDF